MSQKYVIYYKKPTSPNWLFPNKHIIPLAKPRLRPDPSTSTATPCTSMHRTSMHLSPIPKTPMHHTSMHHTPMHLSAIHHTPTYPRQLTGKTRTFLRMSEHACRQILLIFQGINLYSCLALVLRYVLYLWAIWWCVIKFWGWEGPGWVVKR